MTPLLKHMVNKRWKALTLIFNESVKKAVVPNVWKISAIITLPKTHNTTTTDDTRPISLIAPPAKLLERIILGVSRLFFFNVYGEKQFGFRAGSSATCALIKLHDHITKCLEILDVTGVQIISYDFSKAFDRLSHEVS